MITDLVPGTELPPGRLVRMPRQVGLAAYARAAGGKHGLIEMARLSSDRRLQELVTLWDNLSRREQERSSIEQLCDKLSIPCADFLAEVVRTAYTCHIDLSHLILAVNQPRLTHRLIQLAMRPEGARYMEMALRAAGRFPMPEGHRVALFQRFETPEPPAVPGLPSPEEEALADVEFQRSHNRSA